MIHVNKRIEPNPKAWVLRFLIGPAYILDGIISTVTIGTVGIGAALFISKHLAKARINA